MESTDSGSTSTPGASSTESATAGIVENATRPSARRRVWLIALSVGLGAGIFAWLIGESTHGYFRPRLYSVTVMGVTAMRPSRESQQLSDTMNATLAYAILGGATGLFMGLGGGLAGRSPARGVAVGLAALVAGAVVGYLASTALVPLFFRGLVPDRNDLLAPIMIHGGIFIAIGAVGGLAFAIGMPCTHRLADVLAMACVGAILATFLYHVLSGTLFPMSASTDPVANTRMVRFLAMLLTPVLVAAGAAWGASSRGSRPAEPTPIR